MRSFKIYFLIISVYLLVAVLFTWPLATKISTNGFGHDEDAPYHIWHNWWLKYSLFNLKQNPLHTDFIFHPQKINLIYDANSFVFATLTLPLQFLTGNVVLSSNLIFLLSFGLSGLFAFVLANELIKNKWLAFLSGLIFAFNPYVLAQAVDGHTNLTSTWMIPLYTFFLLRSLGNSEGEGKFNPPNGRIKFQIAAGLVATLQFYNDFTYTSFMIVETALIYGFCIYKTLLKENKIEHLKSYILSGLIIGGTVLLLGSPILYEVFKASREGFRAGSPTWVQNVWSADLLTFVKPNDQATFLKNSWTPQIGTVEGTAFLGYTVIAFIFLYLVLRIIKKLERSLEENLMFFLAISFFLLMLGPSLHYKNEFQFDIFGRQIIFPLPYLLLHKIPFIGETQEPGRMFSFLILPLSVLVSSAFFQLIKGLKKPVFYLFISSCLLLLIFEYLPIPFPTTDISSKPVFNLIQKDPENKAVLVLPLGFNSGNYVLGQSPIGSLQFYQSYFQKPSFRGTVARLPYSNFEYYSKIPVFSFLIDPSNSPLDKNFDPVTTRNKLKKDLDIKYILVFEKKYKRPMGQTLEFLEKTLLAKKFYDSGDIKGYLLD